MRVTYELHSRVKDRWNIERVYKGDQKEEALVDARQLYQEPHIQSVKLVREAYNESENSFSEVVIFDTAKSGKEPEPAAPYIKQSTTAPSGVSRKAPRFGPRATGAARGTLPSTPSAPNGQNPWSSPRDRGQRARA